MITGGMICKSNIVKCKIRIRLIPKVLTTQTNFRYSNLFLTGLVVKYFAYNNKIATELIVINSLANTKWVILKSNPIR